MHMSKITADSSSTHCFAIIPVRQRELARDEESEDREEGEVCNTPIRGIILGAWIKDPIVSLEQDVYEKGGDSA